MRIAIVNKDLCSPQKCKTYPCMVVCPRNRAGDKCIVLGEDGKPEIDESLCIGCGLCLKKCPKKALEIVNTPEQLKESPIHRFGKNKFILFRLPFPKKGEVVGLLGQNGVGKTTALKILSGDIKPNLGTSKKAELRELVKIFRGTELQDYLENLIRGKIRVVLKPQHVDLLAKLPFTVSEILEKYEERGNRNIIIEKLHLKNCLDRKLSQLSGGELQRVAIAIAANREAEIYYIDEPSSYLDVYQRLQTAKLLRELAKDNAVVVVEHDLATLDFLADRIHVFYGVPGCYGIVSKPYSTRVGINVFLDGYIKEDNVRIRDEPVDFKIGKMGKISKKEVYLQWTDLEKKLGDFHLNISSGYVNKGEILGLFGSNALGKTTFAKILAGELKVGKGEISEFVQISYKPQYISTDFSGTLLELLQTVVENPYSDDYKAMILRPLELERLLENPVKSLSGGELQRVAIALCLSKDVDLYLLDEPSAFLDCEQRLAVAKCIQKICERQDKSAMIIDHDLLFLSYLVDRAMLFSGEPGKRGSARQFEVQDGFNEFLKSVSITFRRDETGRVSANKIGSVKDREQRKRNEYFIL